MTGSEVAVAKVVQAGAEVSRELHVAAEAAKVGSEAGQASELARLEGIDLAEQGEAVRAEAGRDVPLLDSKGEVHQHISQAEADHFEEIGLEAKEVAGREALVRDDIEWDYFDEDSQMTNLERAEKGLSPVAPDGKKYELHHVGREDDGVLAELTQAEHTGGKNNEILHGMTPEKPVDHSAFAKDRAAHWKARAAEVRAERAGG